MPRNVVATGTAQYTLTVFDELVVGLGLLPVQRADAPAVQRVVLESLEPGFHLFLGQVEPELEDQCAFVAEHFLQALSAIDGLIEPWVLDLAMNASLQIGIASVREKGCQSV